MDSFECTIAKNHDPGAQRALFWQKVPYNEYNEYIVDTVKVLFIGRMPYQKAAHGSTSGLRQQKLLYVIEFLIHLVRHDVLECQS